MFCQLIPVKNEMFTEMRTIQAEFVCNYEPYVIKSRRFMVMVGKSFEPSNLRTTLFFLNTVSVNTINHANTLKCFHVFFQSMLQVSH